MNNFTLTTVSGLKVDPLNLTEDVVDMSDISISLSKISRFLGHTKLFYSVGNHSILCAYEAYLKSYSIDVIMLALLHDTTEAYLLDIPTPLKSRVMFKVTSEGKEIFVNYEVKEAEAFSIILSKYGLLDILTDENYKLVKEIDSNLLDLEVSRLRADKRIVRAETPLAIRSSEETDETFIRLFTTLLYIKTNIPITNLRHELNVLFSSFVHK